ncbi:MAG: N-acetylmuramoyl-L-alanine amidase [Clostridia bacterium]|nr:N-acetylmuramoyl-L-alanine amidase [Clostridia bacterium]
MIILQKNRIFFLTSLTIISFAFYTINMLAVRGENTIETVATPATGKVVILDAGHGVPDEGAIGVENITESDINLQITMKVQYLLEQSGCIVILTRSDENGIFSMDSKTLRQKKASDLNKRVEIGNTSDADIFVSIHLNKIDASKYWGWQTFYKNNNEEGKKLAISIQEGLNKTIKKKNNREALSISNKYIIDNIKIPVTIVECGFLSNTEEAKLLITDEYQSKIAWGIYIGINNYFLNKT